MFTSKGESVVPLRTMILNKFYNVKFVVFICICVGRLVIRYEGRKGWIYWENYWKFHWGFASNLELSIRNRVGAHVSPSFPDLFIFPNFLVHTQPNKVSTVMKSTKIGVFSDFQMENKVDVVRQTSVLIKRKWLWLLILRVKIGIWHI